MKARDVIEAEDPKSVLKQAKGFITFDRLRKELLPLGFKEMDQMGTPALGKFRKTFFYVVTATPDGGANLAFYRDYEDGKGFIYHETVKLSNLDYLMKHLRLFRLVEAEDPKAFLKRHSSHMTYITGGRETDITDAGGNVIRYSREYAGTPVVGWLRYRNTVREDDRAAVGARLLNAALDYARQQDEYRIRVSIGTTRFEDARRPGQYWDVDRNDPAEIGNLIDQNLITSASGMVRFLTLESVLSLEPGGGRLRLDTRPKAPRSIWTHRRKTPEGEPEPYHRIRTLPSGKPLEIFVAYRKDQAPTKLLRLAKQYGPEVAKMATWAADDLHHELQDRQITVVTPMPSAKPLARRLARLLANRLGVPFEDRVEKTGSVSKIPIPKRKAVAPKYYSVTGKFRGQTVCIVDDYVVTSASLMAAAQRLYQAGARKVIAAAFAI